jgi:hypothetical protein
MISGDVMRFLLSLFIIAFSTSCFSQIELIKNGDFADSTSNVWQFGENGSSATGSIDRQKYQVVISSPGNSAWSPQLQQADIPLHRDTAYILKFDVWAASSGKIEVILCSGSFKKYLDTIIEISSIKKNINIQCVMKDPTDINARLQFNFGLTTTLKVAGIDNVSLKAQNESAITVLEPNATSKWQSVNSHAVSWTSTGFIKWVTIRYSMDGGITWKPVIDSVENVEPKTYSWKVPSDAYGNNCYVLVSSADGMISDTSESFSIVRQEVDSLENLVENGSFHDKSKWVLQSYMPAIARDTIVNGEMLVIIEAKGTASWQVKLQQDKISLEQYKFYEFSYDAYATDSRKMYANVGFTNGFPAWSITGGDSIPVTLSSEKKRFTSLFYMAYPSSKTVFVEFNLGDNTRDVIIDNVLLREISPPQSEFLGPIGGQVLKIGDSTSIKWKTSLIPKVSLKFSSDSGKTWSGIAADTIVNSGSFSWIVPSVSSENCFFKILDPGTGAIIGQSGRFLINKFGAPIRVGELITNGTFDDSLNGWKNMLSNGAVAVPELNTNAFGISIVSGGNNLSDIVLSQSGLIVFSGNSYLLSFSAFANLPRVMRIRLIDSDSGDSVKTPFFDTLVNVALTINDFKYMLSVSKDCNVKLEFLLGGDSADIFIDNVSLRIPTIVKTIKTRVPDLSGDVTSTFITDSKIEFRNKSSQSGAIDIFNLSGVLVTRLHFVNGYAVWDFSNKCGSAVARGSYFARITTPSVRKVFLFSSQR